MIIYDRATTKLIYGLPPEHEYGRWNGTFANGASMWRNMVNQRVRNIQGIQNTTRILVVGCGLGLLVEGLKDEGFSRVWGIGLDDYFASLWDQATCPISDGTMRFISPLTKEQSPVPSGQRWPCEVRADIRPLLGKYDIRTMTQAQVGTLTGLSGAQRAFDLIITEDVMTAYGTQAAWNSVYTNIDARLATGGKAVHLVSLESEWTAWGGSPFMNLPAWTATLGGRANHSFQDIAGVSQ